MPKRTTEEKIERYERKIRKLRERDVEQHRQGSISSNHSCNEDVGEAVHRDVNRIANANSPVPSITEPESILEIELSSETEPAPKLKFIAEEPSEPLAEGTSSEEKQDDDPDESQIDPDLLEALCESTSDMPEYGEKIYERLAKLWLPLLARGMPKNKKEQILKKYLIPNNCRLLQAPKLNPEVSAVVTDSVRNRDRILEVHQQQLGSGITAINRALHLLLSGDDKKKAIQHLGNACRLLSDLHIIKTNSRIKYITPFLEKNLLRLVKESERDEFLFGSNLSERIRAAKTRK